MENVFKEILWVEQTVTYTDPDGRERIFIASGDEDSIEVFMPDAEKIDVLQATESIMSLKYRDVTLGVISEEGILFVPEDSKLLVREYHYKLSVKNEDIHVILDWNTVDGISRVQGDMLLSVHRALPEELTSDQKRVIKDRLAISVTMTVGGELISQLGGHADIFVKTNDENIKVYYVEENGRTTLMDSSYLEGNTHTNVNHFSVYMYTDDEITDEFPLIWIVLISIAVISILLVLFLIRRKRD